MSPGNATAGFAVNFALTDQSGHSVDRSTYAGRYLLVYFGFTNCKEVCPRAAAKLSSALEQIGADAEQIVPLFVTVDPERDAPEVLAEYLGSRFPRFTGLTGDADTLKQVRNEFRVFARRRAAGPDTGDNYQIAHTSFAYLVDPTGWMIAHFMDSVEADEIASSLRSILAGSPAARPST
jgi:protein SCO1/2